MSPDSFAAALDVLCQKKHGFHCNPGIDGGVEQTNMGVQFFESVSYCKLCIIAAITSGAPQVSPDCFAAALNVLCQKNMDFSVILELTAK